jgi:glutamate synthase domain-containing protein 1/DNA-binding transcriptional LysR family regulator
MNLKSLKVFCDVVGRRSFSRAAAENGISQSGASQIVNHLEEHLEVKLIDRTKRPFVLTPEGEAYYEGCRKLVQRYFALEEEVKTLHEEVSGRVSVASIYSIGLSHMSRFVQSFLKRYPKANVRLQYQHPRRVYELVETDQVDLGLVSYPRSTRTIRATAWREEPMVVVCSPQHPLARKKEARLEDLQGLDLVAFDPDLEIRAEIDRALAQRGVELRVAMEFDNTETIKRAVEINAGMALLPRPTVDREVQSGAVVALPLVGIELTRPIGIIQRRAKTWVGPPADSCNSSCNCRPRRPMMHPPGPWRLQPSTTPTLLPAPTAIHSPLRRTPIKRPNIASEAMTASLRASRKTSPRTNRAPAALRGSKRKPLPRDGDPGASGEPGDREMTIRMHNGLPQKHGLYDPANEKDSCGVGFIAHIKGVRSHRIVRDACEALRNMDHRGACGCEKNTGDGAGILTAIPDELMRAEAKRLFNVELPEIGRYAVAQVFLPRDAAEREICKSVLQKYVVKEGQKFLGWRPVPTNAKAADIGRTAQAGEPVVEQLFIAAADDLGRTAFCRELYLIRKQAYHEIRVAGLKQQDMYYVCSFSSRVIIYKGQLTAIQLVPYYPDLADPHYTSHLAMIHSRFSTNTFPSWERAQPMRFMCHNGEINTLRGNVNWMLAREGLMKSELFGDEFNKLLPIVDLATSDSGMFDNVLELLLLAGRSLPEAVMMMIPEAWQNHESMPESKRAFYEYHSCLMEPWDGPASVVFTDGRYIGAVLDRNGLRPSRYYLTNDDRVIMASEVGVLPVDPGIVKEKGRLQPGRMFLVDFEQGKLIPDDELKKEYASRRPYAEWLEPAGRAEELAGGRAVARL